MTTYYKVVRLRDGRFMSAMVASGPCMLEYLTGKVTRPAVGAIFAFGALRDARRFCAYLQNLVWSKRWTILEGCGLQSRRKLPREEGFWESYYHQQLVAKLWTGRRRVRPTVWPKGTVLLKEFTPTREVI